MSIDLTQGPIDPDAPEYRDMLSNLQGNILKGHGRDFTVHIFFRLKADKAVDDRRAGVRALAARYVVSAKQQWMETLRYKKHRISGGLFGNLFLSAAGYANLGFPQTEIKNKFPENDGFTAPVPIDIPKSNFNEGMAKHGEELKDPPVSEWEEAWKEAYKDNKTIDGMLLLADDDVQFLMRKASKAMNEIEEFAEVVVVEKGIALRNEEGDGIEHFGYVDGRSQPIYFQYDLEREGDTDIWNPGEPLERVLVPDNLTSQPDSFGSYLVFRKLEQDVLRFKLHEHLLADALGLKEDDRERVGAMVIGRFEDGTPITLCKTDGFLPAKENNFIYADDADGMKCPFQAHIRKINPRGDTVGKGGDDKSERKRRITRRAITYGERNMHSHEHQRLEDFPTGGVGLLFMCFQASIANQFAYLQSRLANHEGFLNPGTGIDPIIGQTAPGKPAPVPQQWRKAWGKDSPKSKDSAAAFDFRGFVTLKGGEFFFAPSIPFFSGL